jgi:hypothetical protein
MNGKRDSWAKLLRPGTRTFRRHASSREGDQILEQIAPADHEHVHDHVNVHVDVHVIVDVVGFPHGRRKHCPSHQTPILSGNYLIETSST